MVSPNAGSKMMIQSYKHNGQLHRIWKNSVVLKGTESIIIGANDRTKVIESDGHSWMTREPAICYFDAKHWFNIIGMLRDDGIHYYCNLSSPFVYDEGAESLKYIDYDLDVKVFPDMTFNLLDEDEYEENKVLMKYPEEIHHILYQQLEVLIHWIRQGKGPFSPGFVDDWYEMYLTYH
ncbi:UPF0374 protein YgaC [Oceanobacillus oncorhynchi subsp. incaldanensis]|uniref:DUF402 domain-containing protein n=2 Tax=Oceanobacillus TaxID=182709 RepID=A0A0A1MJA4_9BACI|nr:DUF402 domain-containing protein [Oceanobacillus oncorhynchi]MDM8102350.1 DUF402 domain-containing protein [Oceanobacillus oncorhynchi]UUI41643.1 DUF402 domain-containing protein [Oceanobacillus oncorhynchi]GIO17790.1 UPF0374 protein YgaC [Oceanobacillus oncorhynchi subsp. incaldanensis]CEI83173.1 hypothetical protein BN997_03064 [Oceanobacillus oncorhynchi]